MPAVENRRSNPLPRPSASRVARLGCGLLAAAFALAGCQHGAYAPGSSVAHHDHAADIVARADWSKTTDVVIEMVNYEYRPNEIRLKANHPYRITLVNYSRHNHYFTAPEFFRSAATRKAMVERVAEVKAPYFTAFEVMAGGGAIDVYLIPLEKGRFRARCDMKEHLGYQIEGVIIVE
jgi:hypothetical protein